MILKSTHHGDIVIDTDDEPLFQGRSIGVASRKNKRYYGYVLEGQKQVYLHRFILGETDPKVYIDHIDRNGLNNRRSNLRRATAAENVRNSKIREHNTSGYKGVSFNLTRGKWAASIMAARTHYWLGYFDTPIEAAKAYNAKAIELHGEFACINEIPEPKPKLKIKFLPKLSSSPVV